MTSESQIHTIRIDPTLWADAKRTAEEQGSNTSAVIRRFLAWYVGQPGATLPERPGGDADTEALDHAARVQHEAVRALQEIEELARNARSQLVGYQTKGPDTPSCARS
jgi:hypothetical protein